MRPLWKLSEGERVAYRFAHPWRVAAYLLAWGFGFLVVVAAVSPTADWRFVVAFGVPMVVLVLIKAIRDGRAGRSPTQAP